MPEKYLRRDGLPILLRHTGRTTLPQDPPALGDGPATICLHDAGLQSSVFIDLLGALAPNGEALAFDLPGHGRSGGLDSLPSIPAMTEMAQWVSDWCRATRPILVGHGMGALIALEWARSAPSSVGGLVLCGLGVTLGIEDQAIETMRSVTRGKAPRPFDPSRICKEGGQDMMRRAYMEGIRTDPRATLVDLEASRSWAAGFGAGADSDASSGAVLGAALAADFGDPAQACPVSVVHGTSEPEDRRARAKSAADSYGAAQWTEIDSAAHFLPLEQPAALAREIRRVAEAA